MKYDRQKLRWYLSLEELESLPVKTVTPDESYELMCECEWNGIWDYPAGASLLPGELGHDHRYRYVELVQ